MQEFIPHKFTKGPNYWCFVPYSTLTKVQLRGKHFHVMRPSWIDEARNAMAQGIIDATVVQFVHVWFNLNLPFHQYRNPHHKIWRLHDRLIFILRNHILGNTGFILRCHVFIPHDIMQSNTLAGYKETFRVTAADVMGCLQHEVIGFMKRLYIVTKTGGISALYFLAHRTILGNIFLSLLLFIYPVFMDRGGYRCHTFHGNMETLST